MRYEFGLYGVMMDALREAAAKMPQETERIERHMDRVLDKMEFAMERYEAEPITAAEYALKFLEAFDDEEPIGYMDMVFMH